MMSPSPACLSLIRKYELKRNASYWDAKGNCWTIGYGHTGRDVTGGQLWTDDECEQALEHDATQAGNQVLHLVDVPLTQGEFDALVDFVFNEGYSRLEGSTLLKLLNNGNYSAAGAEFVKWDFAGGEVNETLKERRIEEQRLFLAA